MGRRKIPRKYQWVQSICTNYFLEFTKFIVKSSIIYSKKREPKVLLLIRSCLSVTCVNHDLGIMQKSLSDQSTADGLTEIPEVCYTDNLLILRAQRFPNHCHSSYARSAATNRLPKPKYHRNGLGQSKERQAAYGQDTSKNAATAWENIARLRFLEDLSHQP